MVPASISLVTLGVANVARSRTFYRSLGWETAIDMDDFAVFRTAGSFLALYPIADLSRDMGDDVRAGFSAAHRGRHQRGVRRSGRCGHRRGACRWWRTAGRAGAGRVGWLQRLLRRPRRSRMGGGAQPRLAARRGRAAAHPLTYEGDPQVGLVFARPALSATIDGVKTFESLFAELSDKAATRPAGSGTVAALDAGVHTIGKKVVEEAAEVWMAAEHESDDRVASEVSQLLYHVQVLLLARGLTLQDVYAHL